MKKTILIFNPVSSAAYLGEKLREFGIFSVALYTIDLQNEYIKIKENTFDKIIFAQSDLTQIREALSQFHFDFVLNGIDEELMMFEAICNDLFPQFSNDKALTDYRKNKFLTQEALKNVELPYIKQIKLLRNNITKDETDEFGYPCFIKPVNGSASIGASVCFSYTDIISNINQRTSSAIGNKVDEFIIQEVVNGTEIFVDVFSVNGCHYISSVQTIVKKMVNNAPCYRYQTIIKDKNIWDNAVEFVKTALNICGFKNGFTHTELFYLSDGTFRLIEVNPRISGVHGLCNVLANLSGLPSQLDLLYAYLCGKPLFNAGPDMINSYTYLLYLYNFSNHPNKNINIDKNQFPTLQSVNISCNLGAMPEKIKTLLNVDCKLILHDSDLKRLEQDMNRLFELEQLGVLL